jgi:hypothetical protein
LVSRVATDRAERALIATLVYRVDIDVNREALAFQYSNVHAWLRTLDLPPRRAPEATNPSTTPTRSAKARRRAKNKRRTRNNLNPPLGSPPTLG